MYVLFCAISYIHFCSCMIYCTYVAICWKKWAHTVPEAERSRFCTGMLLSLAVQQSWWCSLLMHHSPNLKTGREHHPPIRKSSVSSSTQIPG